MRDMILDEGLIMQKETTIQRFQQIDQGTTQVLDVGNQSGFTKLEPSSTPTPTPRLEKPLADPARQSSTESTATTCSSSAASNDHGRLRKLKELRGRSKEKIQVEKCYFQTVKERDRCDMLVIRGSIGCGKTALANSLKETAVDDGAMFITWKFDNQKLFSAGAGFMEAMVHLCQQISETQEPRRSDIINSIKEAGPADSAILMDIFPCLRDLIGPPQSTISSNSIKASGRVMHIAKIFFRAVCAPNRPLVVLLDDLHYIDPCSAKLLSIIVGDTKNDGIMFVATISGELNQFQLTRKMIRDFNNEVKITEIVLKELPEETVNRMVADILYVEPSISEPLTTIVYKITNGNAVFVVEILRMMYKTGILKFEPTTKTWKCEEEDMDDVKSCKDVTALLNRTMRHLPQQLQEMLKAAACFGSRICEKKLSLVFAASVTVYLQAAERLGLIFKIDDAGQAYRFVHSAVQDAAYSLIAEEEKPGFHLALIRRLWKNDKEKTLEEEEPKYLSFLIGQLAMGAPAMKSKKEKYAAVLLCIRGIQTDIEWSMFPSAALTADLAISLLSEDCWREEYDLSLTVYNNAAEIYYAIGDFDKVSEATAIVLENARVYSDKLQAYSTQISVLSSTLGKSGDSIQLGLKVLKEFGETFPSKCNMRHVRREFLRTKFMMRNKSTEAIRRLPNIVDANSVACLRILNLIFLPAFTQEPFLVPLIAMRMLQITVKEGLCAISSFVFSAWGGLLCSYGNEIELGTKFGELALELLHRFQPREWLARVYCGIYGLINPWSKPERSCCAPLSLAYNVGLETGDIEYAMLSAQLRCFLLFDIGTPLPELKRVMLTLEDEMVATKQEGVLSIAKPFWYMIEAFMHENRVEKFLHDESTTSTDTSVQICWKYFHAMFVTFTFCDFERASKYANLAQNIVNFPYKDINISFYLLMSSLADIELVRRGNKSRRQVLPRARRHLKKIEMISRFSPNHSFGKQYLLKAELAAIDGKHDLAFELFVGAIGFSKGEGLLWEQALGAEICGRFMASRNKMEEAKIFLEEAHSVYIAWGGVGKATALQKDINRLFVVN